MIDVKCPEYWQATIDEVRRANLLAPFARRIEYLGNYANRPGCMYARDEGKNTKCEIFQDRAKWSFDFVMYKRVGADQPWVYWFNGGLVFHGGDWGVHT